MDDGGSGSSSNGTGLTLGGFSGGADGGGVLGMSLVKVVSDVTKSASTSECEIEVSPTPPDGELLRAAFHFVTLRMLASGDQGRDKQVDDVTEDGWFRAKL